MKINKFRKIRRRALLALIATCFFTFSGKVYSQSVSWTAAGTSTWQVPAGVTKVVVKVWGAGGAGGGSTTPGKSGGGGGGGAYNIQTLTGLTPLTTYTNGIVVGAGGTGVLGGVGNNGASSSATLSMAVSANGGGGGGFGAPAGQGAAGTGGVGGTYSGGNGSIGINGGAGGGGSAGTGSIGNSATTITGATAVAGGGPGGDGAQGTGLVPVSGPGGGGGGADKLGGANGTGGAGYAGQITLEYFPELTLDNNTQTPGNVCAGSTTVQIHSFSLTGLNNGGTVTSVSFVTNAGGTYTVAEISNFKLYYTATGTFSTSNLLSTLSGGSILVPGNTMTFPALTQAVANATNYFWITMDVASSVTDGHTITVNATGTGNLTSSTPNLTFNGSNTASNAATLKPTPAAPTGSTPQTFCSASSPTVASLSATGTAIKWYDASSGGSLHAGSDALVNGTHYYASQTVSGCESSSRLDVTASLMASSTAEAGSEFGGPICQGAETGDLGGSYGGGATSAIWSDGGAGGTFTNNISGLTPGTARYTAAVGAPTLVTLTLTASPACGSSTDSKDLTVTPTVGTPIFTLGATSNRCYNSAINVTYSATATNNTGITYSLDATSDVLNDINPTTGEVTYHASWLGTAIITATATGCNGPKIQTHSATTLSSVSSPAFNDVH